MSNETSTQVVLLQLEFETKSAADFRLKFDVASGRLQNCIHKNACIRRKNIANKLDYFKKAFNSSFTIGINVEIIRRNMLITVTDS